MGCMGFGVSDIYPDIILEIRRFSNPWWEIFIEFCPAIAEIMQLPDMQQSKNGKTTFGESLWKNGVAVISYPT